MSGRDPGHTWPGSKKTLQFFEWYVSGTQPKAGPGTAAGIGTTLSSDEYLQCRRGFQRGVPFWCPYNGKIRPTVQTVKRFCVGLFEQCCNELNCHCEHIPYLLCYGDQDQPQAFYEF